MSSSYYVLLNKSVLSEDNINNVLKKMKNPYNDSSIALSAITIGDYVLASNYSIENGKYSIYETHNNLKMVCKGIIKNASDLCIIYDIPQDNDGFNIIYNELCKNDSFDDITGICDKINSISGNFSIIAINNNGEYILATDRGGSEKIYVGYLEDKPVIYSNYNIQIYFNEWLKLDRTSSVINGYLEINLKTGRKIQKYAKSVFDNFDASTNATSNVKQYSSSINNLSCGGVYGMGIMGSAEVITGMGGISNMDSLFAGLGGISNISGNINSMYDTNTALDAAFAPLINDFSGGGSANDYETRVGKNGTSILDRLICWEDTQKRYSQYKSPPKSITFYHEGNFFNNYTSGIISECKIEIVNDDLINIAIDMKNRGSTPVILNMTDKQYPATNIQIGNGGQEETFFRRSNYGQTLTIDSYPINDSAVVYSNSVTVFKDSEKNGWNILEPEQNISFIACPPIKSPYNLVYDYTKLFENSSLSEPQSIITKVRLETFLQTAIKTGHTSVVIPAFGCEGHKNPPRHIANILKALVGQYKRFFKEIIIGMPDADDSYLGNYRIFRRVFGLESDIGSTTINSEEPSDEEEDEISIDELLDGLEDTF
jgi:uncharacterized protein (TIGR02452 family)